MENTEKLETIKLRGKEVSKAIRELLKKKFPLTKFSVTYDSFAGGDAVRVKYMLGPTYDQVEKLIRPYQYGSFDGMEDMYNNHGSRPVETVKGKSILDGGVKYVQTERNRPDGFFENLAKIMSVEVEKVNPNIVRFDDLMVAVRRLYNQISFPSDKITDVRIYPTGLNDVFRPDKMFRMEFKSEEPAKKETVKPERITELQVLEYGEYSVAVFGPAWDSINDLKSLGGRYNKFLTHPHSKNKAAGWIFRKNQLEQVKQLLRLP